MAQGDGPVTRADLLEAIQDATPESLPVWVGACAEAQALAQARITAGEPPPIVGSARATGTPRNLSASEAARRVGISTDYLYKEAREGRLPFAVRFGRRVVFDEEGLERWNRQRKMRWSGS